MSDRHSDYARTVVVAHWRMMPTDKRGQQLQDRCALEAVREAARLEQSDPLRTIEWGTTRFRSFPGRVLGVRGLVEKSDTEPARAGSWAGPWLS